MRNKGAILTLVIAFTLVCIYHLSFTWKGEAIKKQIREQANGVDSIEQDLMIDRANDVVYNIGIAKFTFLEVQQREINLGLDLRGGMSVILEISNADIIRSLAGDRMDEDLERVLKETRKLQDTEPDEYLTLFEEAFDKYKGEKPLGLYFTPEDFETKFTANSSTKEVVAAIRKESTGAIDRAFEIIRNRIDQFGVVQPNIQRIENNRDRILVELPGVKNPNRVRNLLQGTANLEFWATYVADDFDAETFRHLDNQLSEFLAPQPETVPVEAAAGEKSDEKATAAAQTEPDVEDASAPDTGSEVEPAPQDDLFDMRPEPTTAQQDDLFDLRPETTTAPSAQKTTTMATLAGMLQFRDLQNQPLRSDRPEIARAHLKDTGDINELLRMATRYGLIESDAQFMWDSKPIVREVKGKKLPTEYIYLYCIKGQPGEPLLGGGAVRTARQDYDESNGSAYVTMTMKSGGTEDPTTKWAQITANNIGKPIAIVMDNRVYSAPTVKNEIRGGSSMITGDFTTREAQDLANLLKAGKLPARVNILQEDVVGPSLGREAVNKGLTSFLIAFVVILLYMVIYYSRKAGLVADIALIANMFFIMGVLASLGAVLTLPGIAGIILTIGMSVDANVLIYERIREEIASGKGVRMAVADGYKNAYSAIIDANVTTLITGIILYYVGTGPIKGFATTLIIGICTSLFSAIFITRLIFEAYLKRNKSLKFDTSLTRNAFKKINFAFIERSRMFYSISIVILLVAVGSLFVRNLDYGVDFTGGWNFVVKLDKNVSPQEVSNALQTQFGEAPKVIAFGEDKIRITTQHMINEDNDSVDRTMKALLYTGLKPYLAEGTDTASFIANEEMSFNRVGPSIAADIKRQAVYAIVAALIFIFLYVILRFRNWQFGLGAIAALIHDSLIVLGIFSLFYGMMPFSLEVDQAFIAAILTVVGYSINDTVVIFDRIREYVKLYPKRERKDIMNQALNSTLSRTFSTSFSTFVVLLAIFVFGGEVIRGFVFALLVGIVVGTYSSLFIATPIVYHTIKRTEQRKLLKSKK